MKPNKPLQIGVTGGIGSGKSLVCTIFATLGIPIYEADTRAKWIINNNPNVKSEIIKLLGQEAYGSDGLYKNKYVASKVFSDPMLLAKLNAIIHPSVGEDTMSWIAAHINDPYVIKEAAIMKAAGDENNLDYVIVVDAPESVRIERILKRDQRTQSEIKAIISRQITDEQRTEIADFTIINDGSSLLIPQIWKLHQYFLAISKGEG